MSKALGYVVYDGPSSIDGSPIAVILTGFASKSTNTKTGGMIQSYIIRTDIAPTDLMRAALIVEGMASDLAWVSDPATPPGEVEDLRRLALGLRELASGQANG